KALPQLVLDRRGPVRLGLDVVAQIGDLAERRDPIARAEKTLEQRRAASPVAADVEDPDCAAGARAGARRSAPGCKPHRVSSRFAPSRRMVESSHGSGSSYAAISLVEIHFRGAATRRRASSPRE